LVIRVGDLRDDNFILGCQVASDLHSSPSPYTPHLRFL
jgi:hypothetical protein